MSIRDWPEGERPREKLLEMGPTALTEAELLAILLRTGIKGQSALELLDQVRAEGWPGPLVVADAGYGVAQDFRDGLQQRGRNSLVGVTEAMVVFKDVLQMDMAEAAAAKRWAIAALTAAASRR